MEYNLKRETTIKSKWLTSSIWSSSNLGCESPVAGARIKKIISALRLEGPYKKWVIEILYLRRYFFENKKNSYSQSISYNFGSKRYQCFQKREGFFFIYNTNFLSNGLSTENVPIIFFLSTIVGFSSWKFKPIWLRIWSSSMNVTPIQKLTFYSFSNLVYCFAIRSKVEEFVSF